MLGHYKYQEFFAEVSITAKSFFEKKGVQVVKKQILLCHEVELINFVMERFLIR